MMNSLPLLYRIGSYLACGLRIFVHRARDVFAPVRIVSESAKTLHSVYCDYIVWRFEVGYEVATVPSGSLASCPEFLACAREPK